MIVFFIDIIAVDQTSGTVTGLFMVPNNSLVLA